MRTRTCAPPRSGSSRPCRAAPGSARWSPLLATASQRDRAHILASLARPGEERAAALSAALATADEAQLLDLAAVLVRIHEPAAVQSLIGALRLPAPAVRRAAATALAALRTPEVYLALQRASEEDDDPEVRAICSVLLSR